MHRLRVAVAGVFAAGILLLPVAASAQASPVISFGGRVVSINFCIHGAVNIIIIPAGFFPVSYVWSLPPATFSVLPAPPHLLFQHVYGLAAPVPVPCVGFGTHPPIWWGLQVIYGGVSPLPDPFIGV